MADAFEVYRGSKDKNNRDVFYDETKIKLFGRISNIQCYNSSFIKYSINHFPSNETFDVIWWINAFTERKDQSINHGDLDKLKFIINALNEGSEPKIDINSFKSGDFIVIYGKFNHYRNILQFIASKIYLVDFDDSEIFEMIKSITSGYSVENYEKKEKGSNYERFFSIQKSFEDLKVSEKNEMILKDKFEKLENFMRLNNINIFCAADIESILSKNISILDPGDSSTHFVETFINESLNKIGSVARMRKGTVFGNKKSNRQSVPQFYSFLPCNTQIIHTILCYLRQFNTNSSIINPSKNTHCNMIQELGFSTEKFNEIVGIVCCTKTSLFMKRINTNFLLNWLIMDNKMLKINKSAYFVL